MTASAWSPNSKTVSQANATGLIKSELQTATDGQRNFVLQTFAFAVGTGSSFVYRNGLALVRNLDYVEIDGSTISLSTGSVAGDKILILGYVGITGSATTDAILRADLLAASGSNIVNYQLTATASVVRSIYSKLSDVVSVKDFGAVGNGSHDDTANIQAAIDAIFAVGGGTVYFPRGIYKISGITTHTSVELVGEAGAYQPDSTSGTQLKLTGNNIAGIKGTTTLRTGIRNMRIDGSALTGTANHGIFLDGVWEARIQSVTVYGITPAKGYECKLTTGPTLPSFGAQHNIIDGCEFPDGILRFEGKGPSDQVTTTEVRTCRGFQYEGQHAQITFINATAEGWTTGSGFNLYGSGNSMLIHCDIEGNGAVGITQADTHLVTAMGTIWVGYTGAQRVSGILTPPEANVQSTVVAGSYFADRIADSDNNATYTKIRTKVTNTAGGSQTGHHEIVRKINGVDTVTKELRDFYELQHSFNCNNVAAAVLTLGITAGGPIRIEVTATGVEPGNVPFSHTRCAVISNNFGTLLITQFDENKTAGGYAGVLSFTASGANANVNFNYTSATVSAVDFFIVIKGKLGSYTKN